MTGEVSPLAGVNVRTLTERLCEVEAVMAVVGSLSATLRAELLARAIDRWTEDGTAPTFRAPGLGSVSLSVPQQKVVIADGDEFSSWVAQRYPTEVVASIVVTGIAPQDLEAALTAVRAALPEATVSAQVLVAPAFVKRLLDKDVVVADSGGDRAVIDQGTGEVVAGVKVIPGANPADPDAPRPRSISVRLEEQAKADAAAQAEARLVTVLERGLSPALADEVAELTADDHLDADARRDAPMPDMPAVAEVVDHLEAEGEPDEPELCACGHPRTPLVPGVTEVRHGGKTGAGRCSAPGCDCKRFRVPAVAW